MQIRVLDSDGNVLASGSYRGLWWFDGGAFVNAEQAGPWPIIRDGRAVRCATDAAPLEMNMDLKKGDNLVLPSRVGLVLTLHPDWRPVSV